MTLQATTTQTVTQKVMLKPTQRRALLLSLREYQRLKVQRDAIDAALKAHNESIESIREAVGEKALELDGFKVRRVEGTRCAPTNHDWLAAGVTITQIEQARASATKPMKPYTRIFMPGEPEVDYGGK